MFGFAQIFQFQINDRNKPAQIPRQGILFFNWILMFLQFMRIISDVYLGVNFEVRKIMLF